MQSRLRLNTRSLLIAILPFGLVFAVFAAIDRSWRNRPGYGPLVDPDVWPRALRDLTQEPSLPSNVRLFGLVSFIDHESIWCIEGESPVVDALFRNNALNPTTATHPRAQRLLSARPSNWPALNLDACTWFSTPGYGSAHIEGVDLFLVVRDKQNNLTIVLHEWIF